MSRMTANSGVSSIVLYAARTTLLVLAGSLSLVSCTHLEKRVVREFSGVVLHADDERPIEGALVVLYESRHQRIPFPFVLDDHLPIAHTLTNTNGQFHFRVCMTERTYSLDWDEGASQRERDWLVNEPRNVQVRLYTKPTNDMLQSKQLEMSLELEDDSFVESCL